VFIQSCCIFLKIRPNRRPVPQGCTVTLVLRVGSSLTSYSHTL
jgi:hypothetical protein